MILHWSYRLNLGRNKIFYPIILAIILIILTYFGFQKLRPEYRKWRLKEKLQETERSYNIHDSLYHDSLNMFMIPFGCGDSRGGRYRLASTFRDYWNDNLARDYGYGLKLIVSKGSVDTRRRIANRDFDFGYVQGGIPTDSVTLITSLIDEPLHMFVRKDFGKGELADSMRKDIGNIFIWDKWEEKYGQQLHVNLSTNTSGTRLIVRSMLEFAGVEQGEYEDWSLGYNDILGKKDSVLTGLLSPDSLPDVLFTVSSLPSTYARYLYESGLYELKPILLSDAFVKTKSWVTTTEIPENSYGDQMPAMPITTINMRAVLAKNPEVPDWVIHQISSEMLSYEFAQKSPIKIEPQPPMNNYLAEEYRVQELREIDQLILIWAILSFIIGGIINHIIGYRRFKRNLQPVISDQVLKANQKSELLSQYFNGIYVNGGLNISETAWMFLLREYGMFSEHYVALASIQLKNGNIHEVEDLLETAIKKSRNRTEIAMSKVAMIQFKLNHQDDQEGLKSLVSDCLKALKKVVYLHTEWINDEELINKRDVLRHHKDHIKLLFELVNTLRKDSALLNSSLEAFLRSSQVDWSEEKSARFTEIILDYSSQDEF